ncbi:MAG: beta-ketoacyl-ACP synthase II [Chloroflexi bacterium]|nr:beta-ketoacyl-ACP synthase II [Chloroflexota bacterium]
MASSRVVVTGIGIISPLGLDTASTWQALLSGESGVARITAFDPTSFESQIAAEVKGFEPAQHMDRKEARHMDRFAQFAIAAAQEAIRGAQLQITPQRAERVSVIIGSGIGGIITLSQQVEVLQQRGPSRISPFLVPMMLPDMASGQVSIHLGAKGPNFGVVSACSSGSDSIGVAFDMLRRGLVDVALCGGAEAPVCPISISGFNACGALSKRNNEPEKASRPFDAQRDGFIIGEGAAVLVLETLESALERGAEPLAELTGYGATADAYHITHPPPFGEGGARAMRLALQQAQTRPEEIDYINAHGTSTPLNDKAETQAIKAVFGEEAYRIPISSTKSMHGHLLGAAGALEAAITVLAVKEGVIPPTINLDHPDPECDLNYTPWMPKRGTVRAALTKSLGFGGHNSTLVFERFQA